MLPLSCEPFLCFGKLGFLSYMFKYTSTLIVAIDKEMYGFYKNAPG